ncbi:MAG TPA: hypothetical protein VGJ15_00670 [Pirellulales bacterium]
MAVVWKHYSSLLPEHVDANTNDMDADINSLIAINERSQRPVGAWLPNFIIVVVVAASLVAVEATHIMEQSWATNLSENHTTTWYGWPAFCGNRTTREVLSLSPGLMGINSGPSTVTKTIIGTDWEWDAWPLLADIVICLTILICTGLFCHRIVGNGLRRCQFGLRSLFLLTAASAIVFWAYAIPIEVWYIKLDRLGLDQSPWYVCGLVLFGIVCTVYTLGRIACRLAAIFYKTIAKPFRKVAVSESIGQLES